MSKTLASDMARNSLNVFLERAQQQRELSSEEGRDLLDSCGIAEAVLDRLWQLTHGFIDRGMEGKRLLILLKELLEVLEVGSDAFATAKEKIALATMDKESQTHGFRLLDQAATRTRKMFDEASELVRRLEKPMKGFDASIISEGRGNENAEGFIGLEDFAAKLASSKDA